MELESQQVPPDCLNSNQAHGLKVETPDSDVVQEIRYLDQVLDAASETPTNGSASPSEHIKPSTASVTASYPSDHKEGLEQNTFLCQDDSPLRTNGHVHGDESECSKTKFGLRSFQEEKRPGKLFTPVKEEKLVMVTRRRSTEELEELERERKELIRGQAVKKNPGMSQRWWNPPQEVPLEEQLDAEQLESLKKYKERKQQKQGFSNTHAQACNSDFQQRGSLDLELTKNKDIVEEQIDFSSARKQFLQNESNKKDVAPQLYTTKPFPKPSTKVSPTSQDIVTDSRESLMALSSEETAGEFTCARAVMTILHEEGGNSHFHSSFHPEESDSGLEELSVRSQDTTMFSSDNVSDSGASLPATPLLLTPVSPPTPQPTTPVNGQAASSSVEDELEYHAVVLVQNALQSVMMSEDPDWLPTSMNSLQLSNSDSVPSTSVRTSLPVASSPMSSSVAPSFQSPGSTSPTPSNPSPQPQVRGQGSSEPEQLQMPSPPSSQPVSPVRARNGGPRIKIQSSYTRALASSGSTSIPTRVPTPAIPVSRPTPVYRPLSPPSPEKPEYGYFSKYSEAAELRSTAARSSEAELASGPFRLRSKKQRTLSMIEEEIRAAQQREEELKRQRDSLPRPIGFLNNSHAAARTEIRKSTISHADKNKTNSLPTKLTLTARTTPGKIEKIRPPASISPSPSDGALSDAGSEDSAGSRPKNYMQTLMEDYETHKVKRREKMGDHDVLEATRVTRRKSDMALKWEAGIYANEEGNCKDEEGEEEEEEEE